MKSKSHKLKCYPSPEEFQELTKQGTLIPVYCEILADMETPVSAYKKIATGKYSFLLESMEGGEKWARFSFIGSNPALIFRSKANTVELIKDGTLYESIKTDNPLDVLKGIMDKYQLVEVKGIPRFCGGAVGYASYDMVRFIEHLPPETEDDLDLFDSIFLITETLLIFDNLTNTIKIVCNVHIDEEEDIPGVYQQAQDKIAAIIALLRRPSAYDEIEPLGSEPIEISSNLEPEHFKNIVDQAKIAITAGEIIQVVLSQRFETPLQGDPFNVYRALRRVNPSPYMYYLTFDDLIIVGASPEVLVRVEGEQIELRPIAGTRPRTEGAEMTEGMIDVSREELLNNPKERAEHIMLIDLERNDLGRVCVGGSVEVDEYMVVESYTHVHHIVSNVTGTARPDLTPGELIRAVFPGGTITGCPKVRCMEIIQELEGRSRGAYTGSMGYLNRNGDCDLNILIRTMTLRGRQIELAAGSGVVADSDPQTELNETRAKAKGMILALREQHGREQDG